MNDGTSAARLRPPRTVAARVVRVLGSFHLACTLFLLLLVVVFVGTVQQRVMSLYDVQRDYFQAWFFVVHLGPLPVPFPGGAPLLGLLLVNLLVGGILRMRWGQSTVGILITHVGIVVLLVGSAIEYAASDKGHVVLAEGASADTFESYTDWELAIFDVAGTREWVIPQDELERSAAHARRFTADGLPFEVRLSGFSRNAFPEWARGPDEGAEGIRLAPRPPDRKQGEANVPGGYVDVIPTDATHASRGALWGRTTAPYTASVGGRTWAFDLRRRRWPLPFRIELLRAAEERYPGTTMAAKYWSDVKVSSDGDGREVHITMNEPLRRDGHTFYQTTFRKLEDGTVESGLAVVHNPTDRVPSLAWPVIAFGMTLHFLTKLVRHLTAQGRQRGPARTAKATA